MSCTPIKKKEEKKPCENSELVITVKKKCIEEPESASTVPAPKPGSVVKTINGIKYFKLQSNYPGDYTKNCGLLGNEIDENFYFLRSNDIKTGYTEEVEDKKYLVLVKVDDEEIRIDITEAEGVPYKFWEEDGHIWIQFPNGDIRDLRDENDNPVTFLIEGLNVHIVTDASIQGDGSYMNPVSLDLAYRTGTYMPADFFVDLSCPEANITMVSGIVNGHACVTKESLGRFGALYTCDEAEKINAALAKEGRGWRVPTKEDWAKLLNWAEEEDEFRDHLTDKSGNFGCVAGARLKSKEYWKKDNHDGRDDFGFTIFPVGVCPEVNNTAEPNEFGFEKLYEVSTFWTSSSAETGEYYVRTFSYGHDDVAQFTESRKKRLSIRLVRDTRANFDIPEYELILGDYLPVVPTTDGTQLWTSINIGVVGYEGYDPKGVTVPEAWKDVETELLAKTYYELVDCEYQVIDEYDLPSYADPVFVEAVPTAVTADADPFIYTESTIHMDMATETKFFYNAWDGNRWHKKLMREGESVVLLYEDYVLDEPCDTAATPYVTDENKNHEWRIFVNKQTGLDELIDTAEALKGEFRKEFKEIYESISGLTENVNNLSGFVGDMYDEMQSGFSSAFTAISELQDELDVVEASVGLSGDGTFIVIRESGLTASATTIAEAIGILDDTIIENEEVTAAALNDLNDRVIDLNVRVNELEGAIDEVQEEVDNVENAVGLDENGNFIPNEGNYTSSAETVEQEISALDNALKEVSDEVEELKKKTIEPLDDSIVVEVSGYTTYVGVKLDPEDEHIKLGENGLWFDGDFGEAEEDEYTPEEG